MWALSLLFPIPLAGSDSDPGGDPADSPWHVCLTIASAAAGKSSRREIEEGRRRIETELKTRTRSEQLPRFLNFECPILNLNEAS